MRFIRVLLLSAVIVGAFLLFTSKSNFGLRRIAGSSPLWSGPSAVRGAGLQPDELNNIDIYRSARPAAVYITSTVYQQNWFFQLTPVRDLGSGFLINGDGEILTNH